ncbi:MAG: cytochrome P450 [Actinobacteria bacterium]|nr:MAG: cytochrome P450 [Actinomycetota bacterium]
MPDDPTAFLLDDRAFAGDPFPAYARLRAEAPVARNAEVGFWVLSKHADVLAASTDPATFCSRRGILLLEIGADYASPPTMMHTDPPEHTRYRALAQPGFAPSLIRSLEPVVRVRARTLLDGLEPGAARDVVAPVTVPFPLQIIAELLGIPDDEWPRFHLWSEAVIPGALDLPDDERQALQAEMVTYLVGEAKARRDAPRDDFISALGAAEVDGERLSDDELAMFLVQLLVAGNETSRNMLSGGLVALAERPDQWQALRDDRRRVVTAVEELLRWTTPVVYFMRTATRDVEVRGARIGEGEPVVLLYASANRDRDEFGPSADEFDVTRSPNRHMAFGFGPHFCIGAALARLEGRVLLEELLDRFARVESGGPVERSASPVIAGIQRAPLVFHAA